MRKLLLAAAVFTAAANFNATAQTGTATFDTLSLSGADTFYVNLSAPGQDVGFWDAGSYFPCVFDTSAFGPYWSRGFSYSNMTDSITPGYMNDRSAITASGYNSAAYCVFWQGYGDNFVHFNMPLASKYRLDGFYITNATYAYLSMRDGDFVAKKFGGATGFDPDWFKLTVYGYDNGMVKDSIEHYLADFRSADSTQDYIQRDWQWVSGMSMGYIDSVRFMLSSSDNGAFGMNTPAYFCFDDFKVSGNSLFVADVNAARVKIFPNPATTQLFVQSDVATAVKIYDMTGKLLAQYPAQENQVLNTASLSAGTYFLQLESEGKNASLRFVKQ